jgi:dTDP-4-amino-4,6-dideoxygalactose transaminase
VSIGTKVPYVNVAAQHSPIRDKLLAAVGNVIDHGQFILGAEVGEFERCFAELCGVHYAIGVNSGTDALILALRVLGIGLGDEVITVANSFVASASCIALVGARPVFVDVREDLNIDPALIETAITSHTRAIIPVHLTGRPADMDSILEIAQANDLYVIEDCSQAVGAEYKGRCIGSFGTLGCFSMHPLKTLNACGDGGTITTKDSELCEKLKVLRNVGHVSRDEVVVWSGNSRLDTLQASILLAKLEYLGEWTKKRRTNARFYQQRLADLQTVQVPIEKPHEKAVYHTFVIQVDRREDLRDYLADMGIRTAIHYPLPIHLQKAAEALGYKPGELPVTERQAERVLSLPVYPELETHQLEYVAGNIRSFYEHG